MYTLVHPYVCELVIKCTAWNWLGPDWDLCVRLKQEGVCLCLCVSVTSSWTSQEATGPVVTATTALTKAVEYPLSLRANQRQQEAGL